MSRDVIDRIRDAMRVVIDPELGEDVVDLGFIYEITATDGVVHVTMTATTPGCPATGFLKEGVASSIAEIAGVEAVDVTMTFDPPWTPSRIDPAVRAALGFDNVN
ncbi:MULTISPECIES: metal-sulfur cluster assembly factor [unclassified Bradyrhizobium]|uniref:metal-sulfur cluster assembly factor n=1 Tax=unclassified Bradyrhizobium TaxID=2631580 RepID=UPI0028E2822B|nr:MULTISPECIES: metal-sulfur cluster assembly factor [unclassified Bradyrhizobium]